MEETAQTVTVNRVPIELCQFLKFADLAASGGEAKQLISAGLVSVNGAVETQKRKKLMGGELVEFHGRRVLVEKA